VFIQVTAMRTNLVLPPSLSTYPAFGNGRVEANDSVRAARAIACAAIASLLAVWCAPRPEAAQTQTSAAKSTSRTQTGDAGPQYYDVLGKRYNVLTSSSGYRERGIASWYGHPFDGRPTSSGEMYDMNEMTAAHATLPLPTWVEVTNLKNGKHVVVKVNDRGPFVEKRLIDLSYKAATALDMVRDGTTRVEVRALPGPPPEKAPQRDKAPPPRDDRNETANAQDKTTKPPVTPASPTKPRPDSTQRPPVRQAPPSELKHPPERLSPPLDLNRLFAEAGRFTKRDDAVRLVDSLKAEGVMNAFVVTEDGRRKSLHHVRVGPLADDAQVASMNERLRGLGARRSHSVTMR
jgi:rare lipoprotein A